MTAHVNRLIADAMPQAPTGTVPTVSVTGVRALLEAFGRLGYDVEVLREAADLPRERLADPDGLVPCTAYGALIEAAQHARPRKNVALHLAQNTPIGAYPLIDYLVLSSPTLGEGLRRVSRYYRLVGSLTPLEVRDDEDPIRVVLDCNIPFFTEYSVALPLLHIGREAGGDVRAHHASFRHRPEDVAELEAAFGCEVRVDASWNGFALSRDAWGYVMPRRDPVLLGLLERHADAMMSSLPGHETFALRVRRAQANGLADGEASIEGIARTLAITPRTLQRRLADEGTTFQKELDQVRRSAAERHLKATMFSIAEISFVLGYSEPAAFHRAFRRWNRTTPQAFRAGQSTPTRARRGSIS